MEESGCGGIGGEMVAVSGRTPNTHEGSELRCVDNHESLMVFQ